LASSVVVHAPVLSTQHAPVCCTWQGLGVQDVTVPQTLGTGQLACGATVQVLPDWLQQVPCCGWGHVLGVQVPPLVHTPPDRHAPWRPNEHAPVCTTQQVPIGGCGQGLVGWHEPPTLQLLPAAQLICRPFAHVPVVGLQQVPCCGCGHGLVGWQVCPCVHVVLAAVHWNWTFCTQVPVVEVQHVPEGGTKQGLGLQIAPEVQMLGALQLIWNVMEHTPSCVQHVPLGGCGHGLVGWQVWPCVQVVLAAVHWTCAFCTQPPVVEVQQVPCGGMGQVLGEQTPSSVHTLVEMQLAWLVTVQAPKGVQQRPCGGRHGFGGPQVRLAVHTFGAAQKFWNPTTHPPSEVQQVPVSGHGLGVQTPPETKKFGNEHVPAVPAVHVPLVAQHAPDWARQTSAPASTPRARARRMTSVFSFDRSIGFLDVGRKRVRGFNTRPPRRRTKRWWRRW
jgi:hypothetical protein